MTRDEAIAKFREKGRSNGEMAECWIDVFEALGMLRLTKPPIDFAKVISDHMKLGPLERVGLQAVLEKEGLTIVPKGPSIALRQI